MTHNVPSDGKVGQSKKHAMAKILPIPRLGVVQCGRLGSCCQSVVPSASPTYGSDRSTPPDKLFSEHPRVHSSPPRNPPRTRALQTAANPHATKPKPPVRCTLSPPGNQEERWPSYVEINARLSLPH